MEDADHAKERLRARGADAAERGRADLGRTATWAKRTEFNLARRRAGPVPVMMYVHGCSGAYPRPE